MKTSEKPHPMKLNPNYAKHVDSVRHARVRVSDYTDSQRAALDAQGRAVVEGGKRAKVLCS